MPRMCTRRVWISITNKTYRRLRNTVSACRKSQARIPDACEARNCRQVGDARRGAGMSPSVNLALPLKAASVNLALPLKVAPSNPASPLKVARSKQQRLISGFSFSPPRGGGQDPLEETGRDWAPARRSRQFR
jgi:hypothetical protein